MERRPALIKGATQSLRCQGDFCDLVRGLIFDDAPSSPHGKGSNGIARAAEERDRAYRLVQWVLTKEEAAKLDESGDLMRLRITGRVDPFAYRTAPSKQVDAIRREHRAGRAKLAMAEEARLIPQEEWTDLIKAHASTSNRGRSIGPPPSKGEALVCETCFHVYQLLEKVHRILEVSGDDHGNGEGGSVRNTSNVKSSPSPSPAAKTSKKKKKAQKKRRHGRRPDGDDASQHENIKQNVIPRATQEEADTNGSANASSSSASKPQQPEPQHRQHQQQRRTKRPRVLIADGDKQTVLTITKHFRTYNYVMRTASDGKECIDILQASSAPFDILLLAKNLLTNDAIEITKWLRCRYTDEQERREQVEKAGPRRRLKRHDNDPVPPLPQILIMTSELTPLDLRSYVSVGIDGCIRKPINTKQLSKTVTDAVEYQFKRVETEADEFVKRRVVETEDVKENHKMATDKGPAPVDVVKASPETKKVQRKGGTKMKSPTGRAGDETAKPDVIFRLDPPTKDMKVSASKSPSPSHTTAPTQPTKGKKAAATTAADKLDPNAFSGVFEYDAATSLPFTILDSGYNGGSGGAHPPIPPVFNLVVCHDAFDTLERMRILLSDLVTKHPGIQILLWNYPGQAFTSFADDAVLNNEYLAACLDKLLQHLSPSGSIRRFDLDRPFYLLGHGVGGSVASCYAAEHQPPGLRGLVLVNSPAYVDTHYASVLHDCANVFGCAPETRPDLPVYFYSRFLFSKSYLVQTSAPLALNLYTAVHNPITLRGRIRLCLGMLNNMDTRPLLGDIDVPLISIQGEEDSLIRPLHVKSYLDGRKASKTIPSALKAPGKRTCILMVKGGHELFQEKKKQLIGLIEHLLTGQYEGSDGANPLLEAAGKNSDDEVVSALSPCKGHRHPHAPMTSPLRFEDKFIDSVLLPSSTTPKGSGENTARANARGKNGSASATADAASSPPSKLLLDPTSPSFERQGNAIYKAGGSSSIYPDPAQYPEVSEYMAWRLKRNRKRLLKLDNAARVFQGTFRVFVAQTMLDRLKKERLALTIQRYFRGRRGRDYASERRKELWAALFVQRVLRGHRGRCNSYRQRLQRESQIRLARRWRGTRARRLVLTLIARRHLAATYMQCLWRRNKARRSAAIHRECRDASIVLARMYRGHLGRRRAGREREKYLFSRSQSSGIELGRQLLAEHKLQATRLQSEISLLDQDKRVAEERTDDLLEEIAQFEDDVAGLEKEMHALTKAERENAAVLKGKLKHELRDQKIRLDKEFGVMLAKIADRKQELKGLETKLKDLGRTRQGKNEEMKSLERKLVVLLEAQEQQIEAIRSKREKRQGGVGAADTRRGDDIDVAESGGDVVTNSEAGVEISPSSHLPYRGPTMQQKQEAADLMSSTEQMMKFGFMSMSMTYFSSLNMVRAMKKVAAQDTVMAAAAGTTGMMSSKGMSPGTVAHQHTSATIQVRNWSIEDVSKWLSAQSLDLYVDSFREGAVDGNFLCKLTENDLRGTLGVEHKLHRKKILCGIEELVNPTAPMIPPPVASPRPSAAANASALHQSFPEEGSVAPTSPLNIGVPPTSNAAPADTDPRPRIPTSSQEGLVPPSFEELATWVRNKKVDTLREAVNVLPTKPFDERDVRVQFVEDVGTAYVHSYEKEVYHLNKCDDHGNTLLHVAAQNGNVKIAKLLLSKGANPNHQNKEGQTPGHFAIAYQFFDFATWLFDDSGNGGKANDGLVNSYGLGVYDGLGRKNDKDDVGGTAKTKTAK